MTLKLSKPTGAVFVRNFDEGMAVGLGGVAGIRDHPLLGKRNGYWITMAGATAPALVPIIFNDPEQVDEKRIYPSFLIERASAEPALGRWHSVKQLEYTAGVSGTQGVLVVGGQVVSGYAAVEQKAQAWPYDLTYTITCFARYEHEALPMLRQILKRFPPYSRISVIDSLGETRYYTTFGDGGFQNQSEIVDVADRVKSYAVSIRVEGELDLSDPVVRSTVATFVTGFGIL